MIKISVLVSLYKCENFLDEFFSHVNKVDNLDETEFIFIHNDALQVEKDQINKALGLNTKIIFQYIEVPREPLYRSWNRGILAAKGEFIAVWNVDDVRFSDSLRLQKEVLDNNKSIGLVYGNYEVLSFNGLKRIEVKCFGNSIGLKKFQNGSFIMWRSVLHEIIGYFDEQLMIAGDQDFWYRVADKFPIRKVNVFLGQFRFFNISALSSNSKKQSLERCLIIRRFGFWSPINLLLFFEVNKYYDVKKIFFLNKMTELSKVTKKISLENILFCAKSVVFTSLHFVYPKHKRFLEKNF
jgi:glycosyltransferase involved in cell wall biosynthesis